MTFFAAFFLYLASFSAFSLESDNASLNESDVNPNASKIDWTKPVVSRGFGLEKSQGKTDESALKQYQSGQVFYFFGEYEKAVEKWLPLLERNFPEAQASMGWLYQAGLGVEKNLNKAHELYQKSAEKNNAIAQNNLGVMFEKGFSVKINLIRAAYWYKKSAEQGYRFGQYNYASILLLDSSNRNQLSEIKTLLTLAANQGVKQAEVKLNAL